MKLAGVSRVPEDGLRDVRLADVRLADLPHAVDRLKAQRNYARLKVQRNWQVSRAFLKTGFETCVSQPCLTQLT